MAESHAAIELADACKSFRTPEGNYVTALDQVNLEVAQNEFVTLLGPSGCGKTTLLRCISGFEALESGSLSIEGKSMDGIPSNRRPVSTVFQNYALFPHMNVQDNVGFSLRVAGIKRDQRDARTVEALNLVGLEGMENRMPAQLSGGQQQRVALARSLINRPRTLLLDEPLSALDRQLRQVMQLELKNLQHELGISFVFVTHDQEEALTMSDRIVVLNQGCVQQIGTPEEIYNRPSNRFVADFIGESNLLSVKVDTIDEHSITYCTDSGLKLSGEPSKDPLNSGASVTLLLRPEHVDVVSESEPSTPGRGQLSLILEKKVFVGTDHVLLTRTETGGHPFRVVARTVAQETIDGMKPGKRFRISYPMNRLHELRAP